MTVKKGLSPAHIVRSLGRAPRGQLSMQSQEGDVHTPPHPGPEVPQTGPLSQPGGHWCLPDKVLEPPFLLCFKPGTVKIPPRPSGKGAIILQLDGNENIPFRMLWPASGGGEKVHTLSSDPCTRLRIHCKASCVLGKAATPRMEKPHGTVSLETSRHANWVS